MLPTVVDPDWLGRGGYERGKYSPIISRTKSYFSLSGQGWVSLSLVLRGLANSVRKQEDIHQGQWLVCPPGRIIARIWAPHNKSYCTGTSLVVQWLRLYTSDARGVSLIPGQGSKIPTYCAVKKKKKKTQLLHLCEEGIRGR